MFYKFYLFSSFYMLIKILKSNYSLLFLKFYLNFFNTVIAIKKPPTYVEGLKNAYPLFSFFFLPKDYSCCERAYEYEHIASHILSV